MNRFWRNVLVLILAGTCVTAALPARADSWKEDRDDLYWTGRSVERLLSDDFLDGLRHERQIVRSDGDHDGDHRRHGAERGDELALYAERHDWTSARKDGC